MGASSVDAGSRIADRYVVEELLGAGGMGVVARALDTRLNRAVAIKLLPAKAVGDAHARERLVREARAAASLEHPGIVHVYDVGETDDGGAYLVMELVKGRRLSDLVLAGKLPYPERWRVLIECARALAAAHRAGLVHRDVKPDNVMVRDDGRAVLLDFGLAKTVAEVDLGAFNEGVTVQRLTAEGSIVGTPAYLAPEQAQGLAIDGRADQFALAVVAYEIFTGRVPWHGGNALAVLAEILTLTPVAPSTIVPALGAALDAVLLRALAKQPADRFEQMDAFADALAAVPPPGALAQPAPRRATVPSSTASLEAGIAATMASMPTPPSAVFAEDGSVAPGAGSQITPRPVAVPAPPSQPAPGSRAARRRRRWPWIAALGGVGIGLVGGGAAYRSWQRHHPLTGSDSILACPVLLASGVDEPSGWLGAAGAHLACDRVAMLMGARFDRTLVPADLLNLPRQPAEEIPADPYGMPDARTRTVREARNRADAWLDGAVVRVEDGFRVTFVIRGADGAEVSPRVTGHGRLLYQAVREAIELLARWRFVPSVQRFSSAIARYEPVDDVATAIELGDTLRARSLDAQAGAEECARLGTHRAALGRLASMLPAFCADGRGDDVHARAGTPAVDATTPALLALTAPAHFEFGGTDDPRPYAEHLHAAFDRATAPDARARFAGAEAQLWLHAGDAARARDIALAGVRLEPRYADGWRALAEASGEMLGGEATARAWAAWRPSDEAAWRALGTAGQFRADGADARIAIVRRASVLAPDNVEASARLGETLLVAGRREEARGIAASLLERAGGAASTAGTSLMVEVEASEGRFGEALATARSTLDGTDRLGQQPSDLTLASEAAEIAALLDQRAAFADALYQHFVAPEPPRLAAHNSTLAAVAGASCLSTSPAIAPVCLARIRELVARGYFASVIPGTDPMLDGADRYVRGDFAGAATAWRPLMRAPGLSVHLAAGAMVDAFDRAGEPELADRVDAPDLARPGRFNGADVAYVREARRAEARGEHDRARRLAQTVIDAWAASDPPVSAVAEMRALVGAMPPHAVAPHR